MIFKVGDKVKRVRDPEGLSASATGMPIGATGVVVDPQGWFGNVRVRNDANGTEWGCKPCTLEPLTPPADEQWAADKVRELVKPKPMDVERREREREFDRVVGRTLTPDEARRRIFGR